MTLIWILALALPVQDKIGKDKAPAVASKMLAEAQKKKSCVVKESNQIGEQAGGATEFEGVLRKDFAAVKGTMEIYARGATYLVNTGGRYDPPGEIRGQEGLRATSFRNPALFLAELGRLVPAANFGGDEKVGEKDCRVVDFLCDPVLVRQYLKELGDRVEKALAGADGAAGLFGAGGVFRLTNAFDEKGTLATLRVCVGKDDLLPYKLEFVMRPKIKPGSLPPELRIPDFAQKTEILFSRWDEDIAVDIPGFIKAKWGVK